MSRTTNPNLQRQLEDWVHMVDDALREPNLSTQRGQKIMTFTRTFVPHDVTEDDIDHFSSNLINDEVVRDDHFHPYLQVTLDK